MLTVSELLRGPRPADTLDRPIEHLAACHRRIEQRLDTLARAGRHLLEDRERALEAIDASLRFFDTNGVWHTNDEEESLFPRLLPRLTNEERKIVDALEEDHKVAENLHRRLDLLVAELHRVPASAGAFGEIAGAYRDCVDQMSALYRRHIEIEDSQVADLARRYLTDEELAAVSAEMKLRRAAISDRRGDSEPAAV